MLDFLSDMQLWWRKEESLLTVPEKTLAPHWQASKSKYCAFCSNNMTYDISMKVKYKLDLLEYIKQIHGRICHKVCARNLAIFFLVRSCLLTPLIKCLKGHKSLRVPNFVFFSSKMWRSQVSEWQGYPLRAAKNIGAVLKDDIALQAREVIWNKRRGSQKRGGDWWWAKPGILDKTWYFQQNQIFLAKQVFP